MSQIDSLIIEFVLAAEEIIFLLFYVLCDLFVLSLLFLADI